MDPLCNIAVNLQLDFRFTHLWGKGVFSGGTVVSTCARFILRPTFDSCPIQLSVKIPTLAACEKNACFQFDWLPNTAAFQSFLLYKHLTKEGWPLRLE